MKKITIGIVSLLVVAIIVPIVFVVLQTNSTDLTSPSDSSSELNDEGLELTLNQGGKSYSLTGVGTFTDTELVIPNTYNGKPVTSIWDNAFYGCSTFTSVSISDNITSIGHLAFWCCNGLKSVTIGKNVIYIENDAFLGCGNIESLTVEEGNAKYHSKDNCIIETQSKVLICGCKNSIIPDDGSVISIGSYSFSGRSILTNIIMPDSITSIGDYAFSACNGLKSVTIGSSVTSIGNGAFEYCSAFTAITISDSVTSIGGRAFENCSDLTKVNYLGTIDQWVQIDFSDNYSNPLLYAHNLYIDNKLVTEAKISTATCIKDFAFYECNSLTSVTISDNVISIGYQAFDGCSNLKIVNYLGTINQWVQIKFSRDNSNPLFYAHNFYINDKLITKASITTATSINDFAFYNCTSLTSVTIGDNVTSIGYYAFEGCYKLVEVLNKSRFDITKGSGDDGCVGRYALTVHNGESKIINKNNYLFITDNNTSYLLGYDGNSNSIVLPDDYNGQSYEIYPYAFYNCNSLTNITIGKNVTTIGYKAFRYCSALTNMDIPNKVTTIGYAAFEKCSGLTSVTIGERVTYIDENAFKDCNKLVEIINKSELDITKGNEDYGYVGYYALTVHNGESKIVNKNEYLFITDDGKNYLLGYIGNDTSLVLLSAYNGRSYEIYDYAFYESRDITSVTIPNSVTSIGWHAFENCSGLTSVTIPDSVTSIGWYAFENCSGLTSVTIPNSVASIGWYAFENCSGLTSVTIPNSVTSINIGTFRGCLSLTNILIPASITFIDDAAFEYCSGLTSVKIGTGVTSIGDYAFSSCSGLTSVIIPNSVTSIGARAFSGCSALTSIIIPNSVTSIGSSAFGGCHSLTSITIPDSLTSIGVSLFLYCSALTSITIPDGVISIEDHAFYYCNSLTSITIPNSVVSIGGGAFEGCDYLQFNEYDNALYLGNENNPYFALIKAKKDIYISSCAINDKTKVIADNAFENCGCLTSITIPNGITFINDSVFKDCNNLQYNEYDNALYLGNDDNPYVALIKTKDDSITSCTVNDKTKVIAANAFAYCNNITSITMGHDVTYIGDSAFAYCSALASVTMEKNIIFIGNYAFERCNSLTDLIIPDSVTSIGDWAFTDCDSLRNITIGNNVISIGDYAFSYSNDIIELKYNGTIKQWNAIKKGYNWNLHVHVEKVICTDGEVEL